MVKKVEISQKTIVFTVFFLLSLLFIYYLRDIILQLFVAVLIMSILNPLVDFLGRFKVPRSLAVFLTYLFIIGILVFAIVNISRPLIEQSTSFVNSLPIYIQSLGLQTTVGGNAVEDLLSQIGILPAHFAQFGLSIFSNLIEVLTVLIFAFYMLVSRNRLNGQVSMLFDEQKREKAADIVNKLEKKLGSWARGELFLMFIVGLSNYFGFKLLGVPYALPLSILAGLLEAVPYIGPILAAVPAVIIGFGISPVIGFSTAALAFLVQQVENYVFVPTIMNKSVGLPSLVILLALSVGFRLLGVVGAIVSIPAVLTIQVLAKEVPDLLKKTS